MFRSVWKKYRQVECIAQSACVVYTNSPFTLQTLTCASRTLSQRANKGRYLNFPRGGIPSEAASHLPSPLVKGRPRRDSNARFRATPRNIKWSPPVKDGLHLRQPEHKSLCTLQDVCSKTILFLSYFYLTSRGMYPRSFIVA
jgi:hypothetical protein